MLFEETSSLALHRQNIHLAQILSIKHIAFPGVGWA